MKCSVKGETLKFLLYMAKKIKSKLIIEQKSWSLILSPIRPVKKKQTVEKTTRNGNIWLGTDILVRFYDPRSFSWKRINKTLRVQRKEICKF